MILPLDNPPDCTKQQQQQPQQQPQEQQPSPKKSRFSLCLVGNAQDVAHTTSSRQIYCEIPFVSDALITQVSCGRDWILLLLANGQAFSLGNNTYGQLGQGHLELQPWPQPLTFPVATRIARIACGSSHGALITDLGALFMFGCGSYGRLGTGKEESCSVPVEIVIQWSAFAHEMTGKANPEMRMRSASILSTSLDPSALHHQPQDKADKTRMDRMVISDVTCGDRHTIVVTKHESRTCVFAFGDGMNGRLGTGNEKDQLAPTLVKFYRSDGHHHAGQQVPVFPPIVSVSAGSAHNTALTSSGELFTWGNGTEGQLGHGRFESEWIPHRVDFFRGHPVVQACCGDAHTMCHVRGGGVFAWGRGNEGQLGVGGLLSSSLPSRVVITESGTTVLPISVGGHGTSATTTDATVVVRSLIAHDHMSMVIDDKQQLFVWGDNSNQQLGVLRRDGSEDKGPVTVIAKPRQFLYHDFFTSNPSESVGAASCRSIPAGVITSTEKQKLSKKEMDEPTFVDEQDAMTGGSNARQLLWAGGSDRFSLLVFKMKSWTLDAMTQAMSLESTNATHFFCPPKNAATTPTKCSPRESMRKQLFMSNKSFQRFMEQAPRPPSSKWNLMLLEPFKPDQMPSKQSLYFSFMSNYHVYFRPPEPVQSATSEPLVRGRSMYFGGQDELMDSSTSTSTFRRMESELGDARTNASNNNCHIGPQEDKTDVKTAVAIGACELEDFRDPGAKSSFQARVHQVKGVTDWLNHHSTNKLKKRRRHIGYLYGKAKRFVESQKSDTNLTSLPSIGTQQTKRVYHQVVPSHHQNLKPTKPKTSRTMAFGRTLHCKVSMVQRDLLHEIQIGNKRPSTVPTTAMVPLINTPKSNDDDSPDKDKPKDEDKHARGRLHTEQAIQQQLRASVDMHTIRYRTTMQDLNVHIPPPFHHQEKRTRPQRHIRVAFGTCLSPKDDSSTADGSDAGSFPEQEALFPERSDALVFPTSPSVKLRDAEDFSMAIAKRLEHAKGTGPGPGDYSPR